jgi:hypothetical protein
MLGCRNPAVRINANGMAEDLYRLQRRSRQLALLPLQRVMLDAGRVSVLIGKLALHGKAAGTAS